jgi:dTDP-4-dehydrorhamnose reductase
MLFDIEQKPRILLIGCDGQLGWELRRACASLGEVTGTVGPRTERVPTAGIELDLSDQGSLRDLMSELKPDIVLNAAAYTAVDRAEDEKDIATALNGVVPGVLAREAERHKALLVHYSTDYVFDGSSETPYLTTDKPSPANVYGRTKLQGEEAIRAIGGWHFILRTSWLYAARGNNFLLTMLNLMDQKRPLTVVNDQYGAPTWARSVAEVTAQIIAQSRAGGQEWMRPRIGTYHVTAGGRCSWFEFAQAIVRHYCRGEYEHGLKPVASADYPTKAARPANSVLDCRAIQSQFGISMEHWSDSLARVMEDIKTSVYAPRNG